MSWLGGFHLHSYLAVDQFLQGLSIAFPGLLAADHPKEIFILKAGKLEHKRIPRANLLEHSISRKHIDLQRSLLLALGPPREDSLFVGVLVGRLRSQRRAARARGPG
jgi:hypothetical protein